jgi:hypothetical protein
LDRRGEYAHVDVPQIVTPPNRLRGTEDYPPIGANVTAKVLGYSGNQLRFTRSRDLGWASVRECPLSRRSLGTRGRVYGGIMSRQAFGNALAGVLFFVIAIVDFTRDSSGIGVVFLVFAAVFLGLAFSARKTVAS